MQQQGRDVETLEVLSLRKSTTSPTTVVPSIPITESPDSEPEETT